MKLFKSEHLYDAETQQWVEKFWVNDELVDEDVYYFYLEREKDIEDNKDVENFNECGECNECDCDEINELVCNDNCKECEITCEACRDINIVEDIATEFEESDCQCESCLRNVIYRSLMIGKNIGWDDHKEMLVEFLCDD